MRGRNSKSWLTSAHTHLRREGILDAKGQARDLLNVFRLLRQSQLAYARELGMTPAARVAIKANGTRAALDLAAAMANAEGAEHVEPEGIEDSESAKDGARDKRRGRDGTGKEASGKEVCT